jgi:uncharacterized membrane protein YphA (DoxX/SURF4 family)
MNASITPSLLLRIALAFSLAYPAIDAWSNAPAWLGYLPEFVYALPIEATLALHIFGAIELVLAAWLLWGRYVLVPAAATALLLLAITLVHWGQMDILFRDLSLALAAVALAMLHSPKRSQQGTGK